jgi:hypothetical protein
VTKIAFKSANLRRLWSRFLDNPLENKALAPIPEVAFLLLSANAAEGLDARRAGSAISQQHDHHSRHCSPII